MVKLASGHRALGMGRRDVHLLTCRAVGAEGRRVDRPGTRSALTHALAVFGIGVAIRFLLAVGTMRFDVLGQMVTSHEPLVANRTGKPFFAGVCS